MHPPDCLGIKLSTICLVGGLLALLVLPISSIQGQDVIATPELFTPSPFLTATETESPTATWTDVPTFTPLPTNTTVPTPTSTELPTVTSSPDTAEPAATLTEISTIAPTPTDSPSLSAPVPSDTPTSTSIPLPTAATLNQPITLLNETTEFESGLWSASGGWARSNMEFAHSPAFTYSDSPGVPYLANAYAILRLSQPLVLPLNADIQLQFWQRLNLGLGDIAQTQISIDGLNWLTISSAMTTRNLTWTAQTMNLSGYAGQTLWLQFLLIADGDPNTVGDGWWLDDITLKANPLPVTQLFGLTEADSDNPTLWLIDSNWQAVGAPVYSGNLSWFVIPQMETSTALTLQNGVDLRELSQPELRFQHILNVGSGVDSAQVQVSIDGGLSWVPIAIFSATNNADAWKEQIIRLSSFGGQPIRLRFLLTTDGDGSIGTGWTLDHITIQSAQPTAVPLPTFTEQSLTQLIGVVHPEGFVRADNLRFALEGSPTYASLVPTFDPADGNTDFTVSSLMGPPAWLQVDGPSHLSCHESLTFPADASNEVLPNSLVLRAGDVNSDNAIDIVDAAAIGQGYVQTPNGELDINHDGAVNILDLIHVGRNYGTTGPTDCTP